jgi:hypothetical protein
MISLGFQQYANNQLPVGVAGDFADTTPRASVQAPPQGFVAAPEGLTVGCFGWGNPATRIASNYYQPNSGLGFVHREQQALITAFLAVATMEILPGDMAILMNQGGYWGIFTGGATVGQKVYADPTYGTLTAGATGGGVTANSTAASLATTGVLTVGATLTGTLAPGQAVYATGIPIGSYIGSQVSGSTGSTGTYQLVNANGTAFPVVSSTTVYFQGVYETPFWCGSNVDVAAVVTGSIAANGVMTITAVGSGVLSAGQFLTGGTGANAIPSLVQILSQTVFTSPTTGGGTGVYLVSTPPATVITSTTITGVAGQLGKISSWGA